MPTSICLSDSRQAIDEIPAIITACCSVKSFLLRLRIKLCISGSLLLHFACSCSANEQPYQLLTMVSDHAACGPQHVHATYAAAFMMIMMQHTPVPETARQLHAAAHRFS
jgi:hypothetical protein